MVEDVQQLVDSMRELSVGEKKSFEEAIKVEAEVKELPEHVPVYNLVNAHINGALGHTRATPRA
jgi:hypothetical protein